MVKHQKQSAEYVRGYKDGHAVAMTEIANKLLTAIIGAAFMSGLAGLNKVLSEMSKEKAKSINTEKEQKKT